MTTQITTQKVDILCGMFQFQSGIYHNTLDGLTRKDALKRPSGHSNHINWLLGHILHCRIMLANMNGLELEYPFGQIYWNKLQDHDYPGHLEIYDRFVGISDPLISRISDLTDSDLDAAQPEQPSLKEVISFFAYHEAYHLGQIGYVRKMIGLTPLKAH